jgi:hypothetical protein
MDLQNKGYGADSFQGFGGQSIDLALACTRTRNASGLEGAGYRDEKCICPGRVFPRQMETLQTSRMGHRQM